MDDLSNYLTYQQLSEKFPAFPPDTLKRWQYKKVPGYLKCLRKIRGDVYVNVVDFTQWINQNLYQKDC